MVIVGGGFLTLELASSIRAMGLEVTVVHTLAPLREPLGGALSDLVVDAARAAGVRFVPAPAGGRLLENACGVRLPDGGVLHADVIVSAIGDRPNVEWLAGSGLSHLVALEASPAGVVRPGIVAAGDVVATRHPSGVLERSPHWHSAIAQGRAAARSLLGLATCAPATPYFWTEGFGLELKITGRIPPGVAPRVLEGSLRQRDAVLQWRDPDDTPVGAATVNHRMPLVKLSRVARPQLTDVTR